MEFKELEDFEMSINRLDPTIKIIPADELGEYSGPRVFTKLTTKDGRIITRERKWYTNKELWELEHPNVEVTMKDSVDIYAEDFDDGTKRIGKKQPWEEEFEEHEGFEKEEDLPKVIYEEEGDESEGEEYYPDEEDTKH